MHPKLSILIPTYNRPDFVVERIRELLPQLEPGVELVVVDNASSIIVEAYVISHIPSAVGKVRFVRNRVNIGACANICRSFEVSEGVWTWLLGDDDRVCPQALSIVINALDRAREGQEYGDVFCFSSGIYQFDESRTVYTPGHLWASLDNQMSFSNFLFISTKVIRTASFLRFSGVAYQFCYSAAPHVAVIMSLINSGSAVRFEMGYVVEWEQPALEQSWNGYQVVAGFPSLMEVVGSETEVCRHLSSGLDLALWKPYLRGGLYLILFDHSRPTEYWHVQLRKFVLLLRGKRLLYTYVLLFVCKVILRVPSLRSCFCLITRRFAAEMSSATSGTERN